MNTSESLVLQCYTLWLYMMEKICAFSHTRQTDQISVST